MVRFQLHGSHCGGFGNPSCYKETPDHRQAVRIQRAEGLMIKQLTILVAIIMLGLSAGDAAAKSRPFKVPDYIRSRSEKRSAWVPSHVARWRAAARSAFAPDTVRRVDFNGDGIKDYIVRLENTTCWGVKTGGFCGTGGCMVDFLASLPMAVSAACSQNRSTAQILRGHPRKVRFWIFHGYCPHRSDGCSRDVRIGYRLFTPVY